jgi:hypothetical protein
VRNAAGAGSVKCPGRVRNFGPSTYREYELELRQILKRPGHDVFIFPVAGQQYNGKRGIRKTGRTAAIS